MRRASTTARSSAGATPVIAQFLDMKAAHPDALLFFRMGDFYEMFFEDAEAAAAALGIALTTRGEHQGEPIPMCGVPTWSAERYLNDLIRAGFRVAVAEQMEDPAEAKKRRGADKLVKRAVTRVVTPGTLTEDALLEGRRHNHLAALAEAPATASASVAWTDLSTGELTVTTVPTPRLAALLARIAPSEALFAERPDAPLNAAIEEAGAVATPLPPAQFGGATAEARLAERFGVAALDAFGRFDAGEVAAISALAAYLDATQLGQRALLRPPRRESAGERMEIDPATRRSLEIVEGARGGRAGSLLATIDRTATNAGARLLAARLSAPLTDVAAIRERLDAVGYLVEERRLRESLRADLKGAPDLERAMSRLALRRGGPRDLGAARDALLRAQAIGGRLRALDAPPRSLAAAVENLTAPADLGARLDAMLAATPPGKLADGGLIAEGADPDLDAARRLRDDARGVMAELEGRYRTEAEIPSLKIKHNNVLGYFVETPATHAERMTAPPLSERFRLRQRTANQVRFSTVELAEIEARIARAGDRADEIERRLFAELSAALLDRATEALGAAEALSALDVAAGLAELADEDGWTRPAIDDSRAFEIRDGRHPVVEAALRRDGAERFVANDVDLSADLSADAPETAPIWLLTGPNMAGKSTFLRQNALIAVLAQAGAFTPAASVRLGVVDRLFSRVGASDDLARGRSTFMVEMVETAAILNQAGPRSLVILDEIGRGTATYDGLSIAWATLEHLQAVNRCRALFATHYHELTALCSALSGLKSARMAVTEMNGEVVFLRRVTPGAADRSYGVQVARIAGMPEAVVARARVILETLESGETSATARVQHLVDDLPLFAVAAAAEAVESGGPSPVEERLRALDPDAMSPRDALDALYALRALLDDQSG